MKLRNRRETLWVDTCAQILRDLCDSFWFETNTQIVQRNNRGTCRVCSSCCRGRRCVCSHEGSVCLDLETRAEGLETPRPGGQQHGASVLQTRGGDVVAYWLQHCTGWKVHCCTDRQTVYGASVLKVRSGGAKLYWQTVLSVSVLITSQSGGCARYVRQTDRQTDGQTNRQTYHALSPGISRCCALGRFLRHLPWERATDRTEVLRKKQQ